VGGLFRIQSHAESLARELRAKGFANVSVEKRASADGHIFVVKVGSFENYPEAHAQRAALVKAGYTSVEVRP
jgi:cell division protein FtsN